MKINISKTITLKILNPVDNFIDNMTEKHIAIKVMQKIPTIHNIVL